MSARVLLILAMMPVGGCTMMQREVAWQGLHAIDAAQTERGAGSDACYHEADPITRRLIGARPSPAGVAAWAAGEAALHYLITRALSAHAPRWALIGWQSITIGMVGSAVAHNYAIGVRIVRHNTDYPLCRP